MEKRDKKRFLKRLQVRFGREKPERIGFTHDISSTGIFIKSNFAFTPGVEIQIELTLPDETIAHCCGVVVWAKQVPPALSRLVHKHGMGVHFLEIHGDYRALLEKLHLG